MSQHYLPAGTPIERLTRAAFQAYDAGLSLREARDRLMALAGLPEACDSQINVPFTFLGLLYGGNDLQETMLAALRCGYDTDCTLATAGALLGQILGASCIPQALKDPIGDELVMGIQYRRQEMTLSALARDTARMGILLAKELDTGVQIEAAPAVAPLPETAKAPATWLSVDYAGLPAAAPGDTVEVIIKVRGQVLEGAELTVTGPDGWTIVPAVATVSAAHREVAVSLHAPPHVTEWPMRNLFTARLASESPVEYTFGVAGAGLWRFLGVYYDAVPDENDPKQKSRRYNQHFVSLERDYLSEPDIDFAQQYQYWSRNLGRPAVVVSYQHEVDPSRLIGLRGPYCCYLTRTIISPEARPAYIVVGNNDGFRLYLNGELVAEEDECLWWTPFNNVYQVDLRQGPNQLLVKLLKRTDDLRFTLSLRAATGEWRPHHNSEDWLVDLADVCDWS